MRILLSAVAGALLMTGAHAAVADDFNRADALNTGPAYTIQNGNIRISGSSMLRRPRVCRNRPPGRC